MAEEARLEPKAVGAAVRCKWDEKGFIEIGVGGLKSEELDAGIRIVDKVAYALMSRYEPKVAMEREKQLMALGENGKYMALHRHSDKGMPPMFG